MRDLNRNIFVHSELFKHLLCFRIRITPFIAKWAEWNLNTVCCSEQTIVTFPLHWW